jgi:hypothetical protein
MKVIKFINDFKKKHKEEMEDTFSTGYCYWFAQMIATRFKGDIWYNPNQIHFCARINDTLYDIYGIIEDESGWMSWYDYQIKEHDIAEQIIQTSIKKV